MMLLLEIGVRKMLKKESKLPLTKICSRRSRGEGRESGSNLNVLNKKSLQLSDIPSGKGGCAPELILRVNSSME